MARIITNIVREGNGLRITWSDNRVSQFVWGIDTDGIFKLLPDDPNIKTEISNAIINDTESAVMWGKLFNYSRNNHVLVKKPSDLPDPVNGEIQLADNTEYELNGTIITNNTLVYGSNTMIYGKHWGRDILLYGGTGAALKSRNEVNARFFTLIAPTGSAFDFSADNTTNFYMATMAINTVASIGQVTGYAVPTFINMAFDNLGDGITFSGQSEKIHIDGCPFRNLADNKNAITFNSTFNTKLISIIGSYFKEFGTNTSAFKVDPLATLNEFALISNNSFDSTITISNEIDQKTIRWDFIGNSNIPDSNSYAEYSMANNSTETVITIQNEFVKVAGTTVGGQSSRFTHTNNRLTYNGIRPVTLKGNLIVNARTASGSADIEIIIKKNGTDDIGFPFGASSFTNTPSNLASNQLFEMVNGDYVEIWAKNVTGLENLVFEDLQFVVSKL